jgi:pyruvate dehydrogenase E2 component (dihydrolipoamide acetyltransferase)
VRASAGQTIAIGQPVAFILAPGEQPPKDDGRQTTNDGRQTMDDGRTTALPPQSPTKLRATPLARKLCREHGLDLAQIQGSGPNGRIGQQDVLAFLEHKAQIIPSSDVPSKDNSAQPPTPNSQLASPDDVTRIPLAGLRRVIAERMTASVRNAPHFTLNMQVDMAEAVELRRRVGPTIERQTGAAPSFTALIVRALAGLLLEHRYLNATLEDQTVLLHHRAHIGVAIDRAGDLLVPVLRDAQLLTLAETSAGLRDLHARAQAHTLSQAELRGSTFTVSNLGMYGVDSFTAIINPPESAILAVGRIVETPVARNGAVLVRPIMQLTLSADHRVVDGAAAARFLAALRERLEEPYLLI